MSAMEKSYLLGDETQRRTVTKEYASELIASSMKRSWEKTAGVTDNDTPAETIAELETKFRETCERLGTTEQQGDKIWKQILPLLVNPAMAKFCQDTKAMESEFFPMWLCTVPRAVALEVAYGYSTDLNGVHRVIPTNDPLAVWVDEPVFKYLRWRDAIAADLIHGMELLFFGAGWLPELRYTRFLEQHFRLEQSYYCCDQDPLINLEQLLDREMLPSFDYRLVTIDQMIAEARVMKSNRGYGFNTIVAKGVMSYQIDALPAVIAAAMELMEPNGVFVFDLQLKHWTLVRNALLFNWSADGKFKLLETVEDAVKTVKASCTGVLPTDKIVVQPDIVNDEPVGVVFTINK